MQDEHKNKGKFVFGKGCDVKWRLIVGGGTPNVKCRMWPVRYRTPGRRRFAHLHLRGAEN